MKRPDNFVEIDGEMYHSVDGVPSLDERGDKVPAYICLCHATEASECSCGGWDHPLPDSTLFEFDDFIDDDDGPGRDEEHQP